MAKIWGRTTSSNVQVAMWAAAEVGLTVERIDVGGHFGGTDEPAYRAMNPNGLIPVLEDGDLVLFESGAILRYLAAEYGSDGFWPKDVKRRAPLDVWAEWVKTTLAPVLIYQVFWTLIRTPSAERAMDKLASEIIKLGELMAMADARIGNDHYLGGETLCFADVMFGHTLYRYYTLDIARQPLSNLQRYYHRLTERPAYREHVMVDYSALAVD